MPLIAWLVHFPFSWQDELFLETRNNHLQLHENVISSLYLQTTLLYRVHDFNKSMIHVFNLKLCNLLLKSACFLFLMPFQNSLSMLSPTQAIPVRKHDMVYNPSFSVLLKRIQVNSFKNKLNSLNLKGMFKIIFQL